ncbi:MAG: O-antigen ligase family protein [Candidatus Gottesmanbacteria bacterium]
MKNVLISILFLTTILSSLIIKEGKQAPIDYYWSIVLPSLLIIISVILSWKTNIRLLVTKKALVVIGVVILEYFISSIFSQSRGYSLTNLIRILAACMVGIWCYALPTTTKLLERISKGLLIIGISTACISLAFRFFVPIFETLLPPMNLVFSRGGHNQASYLFLFILPISIVWLKNNKHISWAILSAALLLIAILTSFSRGVMLVTAGYLLFTLCEGRIHSSVTRILKYAIITTFIIAITLVIISFFPEQIQQTFHISATAQKQMFKTPPNEESRPHLWLQAIQGVMSNPITGTGPGTFILTSLRLRSVPSNGASLAHSFPLQTLSELGFLCSLPVGVLLFTIGKTLLSQRKKYLKAISSQSYIYIGLIDAVMLTLFFSCIEYNIDYFTLLLLFVALIGLLLPRDAKRTTYRIVWVMGSISLLLYSYAIFSVFAHTYWKHTDTKHLGYYLTAHDAQRTSRYLEYLSLTNQQLSPTNERLISFFHANTPDVLLAQANLQTSDEQTRTKLYQKARYANPLNHAFVGMAMMHAIENNRPDLAGSIYSELVNRTLKAQHTKGPTIDLTSPSLYPLYTKEFTKLLTGPGLLSEIVAKSLYFLGLRRLPTHQTDTKALWITASDISPTWSLFAIELASYYLYIEHNEPMAKQILVNCQKIYSPRKACAETLDIFPNIGQPGTLENAIKAIPKY